jgi:non-ribosomal peptide synthetase component F
MIPRRRRGAADGRSRPVLPPCTADVARARRQTIGSLLARTAIKYPAVVYRDARRTFAELDADANRVANALAERGVVRLRETYAGLAGAGAP